MLAGTSSYHSEGMVDTREKRSEDKIDKLGLPETGSRDLDEAVTGLMTELLAVRKLYGNQRINDVRLFSVDLDNVVTGISMLSKAHNAGVSGEHVRQATEDMTSLVRDMRARTGAVVREKLDEMVIHTSVSAGRLGETQMVTPAEISITRVLPWKTYPEQSEGMGMFGKSGVHARVSGRFLSAELAPDTKFYHLSATPHFLPKGEMIKINKGEAVAVWEADRGEKLSMVIARPVWRVEPTDDEIYVYGPAFLSEIKGSGTALSDNFGFRQLGRKAVTKLDVGANEYVMAHGSFWMISISLITIAALAMNDPKVMLIAVACMFASLTKWVTDYHREGCVISGGLFSRLTRAAWNWNVRRKAKKHGLISQKNNSWADLTWERTSIPRLLISGLIRIKRQYDPAPTQYYTRSFDRKTTHFYADGRQICLER